VLACGLGLSGCGPTVEPPATGVERVILITCDTLRADRLGFHGYEREVSPHLDQLARESVVFDEAYSTAPMTQPAVSALLSGKLPVEVGATPGNLRLMSAEVETLAERMQAAGYETAGIVANWILRRPPEGPSGVGVAQGFDWFDDEMPGQGKRRVPEKHANETTDAALAWLGDRVSDRFFLWVHYQDPHGPYRPPPLFQRIFESPRGVEEPVPLGTTKLGHRQIPGYQRIGRHQDPSVYRDLYDAEIRYFDRELARLLDALRSERLLDDALLVFTADHGEALGEHDYWFCHGETVYREIVRVPLLVRWPDGRTPESFPPPDETGLRRFGPLVSHLDFVPTVLEAVALPHEGYRGASLFGGPPPSGRVVPQNLWPHEGRDRWWSASDGRHRLIWSDAAPDPRLFDVQNDPYEQEDLSAQEPAIVERLRSEHAAIVEEARGPTEDGASIDLDSEALEALKALGYAGGDEADE